MGCQVFVVREAGMIEECCEVLVPRGQGSRRNSQILFVEVVGRIVLHGRRSRSHIMEVQQGQVHVPVE